MPDEEFCCRIDTDGTYRRIAITRLGMRNDKFIEQPNESRLIRLEFFPPKIDQMERDSIFNWCERTGNEQHFVYLLDRAEQRSINSRRYRREIVLQNLDLAARGEAAVYKPVTERMLQEWTYERKTLAKIARASETAQLFPG